MKSLEHEQLALVRARPICKRLGGKCRRTLYEMIKRGDFPPPDRPAQKRGEADLWLATTVETGINQYLAQRTPRPSANELAVT
jgi:predicted DNA-binding transcriptional regulator AlpA